MHFSYSVLPAISLDGVLHLQVFEHSVTAVEVYHFVDALLDNMNPFPGPNSVLVMDNASIHKSPAMQALIEARYAMNPRHYVTVLTSQQWYALTLPPTLLP
jgi:hypothetical protein